MPHDLRHGQWLKPTLALIASDHREYTAQIQLWTDAWRSTKRGRTNARCLSIPTWIRDRLSGCYFQSVRRGSR